MGVNDKDAAGQITSENRILQLLFVVLIVGLGLVAYIQVSPLASPWLERDQGVFTYIGNLILHGGIPYRDIWDHKPPLIYFINALGLLIGGRWGVFVVEAVCGILAAVVGYAAMRRLVGKRAAFLGIMFFFLAQIACMSRGNFSESYSPVLQSLALLCLAGFINHKESGWLWLVIGVLGGTAFLFKQTMIGLWLAFGVYLLAAWVFRWERLAWRKIIWMAVGALIPISLVALYLALNGALSAFWNDAFVYNFFYSNRSQSGFIHSWMDIFSFTSSQNPVYLFAWLIWIGFVVYSLAKILPGSRLIKIKWIGILLVLAGSAFLASAVSTTGVITGFNWFVEYALVKCLMGVFLLLIGILWWLGSFQHCRAEYAAASDDHKTPVWKFGFIVSIAWIVDLILISLSPWNFSHYYIPLSLSAAGLIAVGYYHLHHWLEGKGRVRTAIWGSACVVMILPLVTNLSSLEIPVYSFQQTAVEYVQRETNPEDAVLFWGNEVGLNYLSQRSPGTLYAYQYPLYIRGYATSERVAALLEDLQANPPVIILDTQNPWAPFVELTSEGCQYPQSVVINNGEQLVPEELAPLFEYLCAHYQLDEEANIPMRVYRYIP